MDTTRRGRCSMARQCSRPRSPCTLLPTATAPSTRSRGWRLPRLPGDRSSPSCGPRALRTVSTIIRIYACLEPHAENQCDIQLTRVIRPLVSRTAPSLTECTTGQTHGTDRDPVTQCHDEGQGAQLGRRQLQGERLAELRIGGGLLGVGARRVHAAPAPGVHKRRPDVRACEVGSAKVNNIVQQDRVSSRPRGPGRPQLTEVLWRRHDVLQAQPRRLDDAHVEALRGGQEAEAEQQHGALLGLGRQRHAQLRRLPGGGRQDLLEPHLAAAQQRAAPQLALVHHRHLQRPVLQKRATAVQVKGT